MTIHSLSMSPRIQEPLSFEYILLGLVSEGPIYGYDLYKKYTCLEGVSLVWHIKQSYLYAYLDKLETKGYLEVTQVQAGNFPMRHEYRLSPAGAAVFQGWVKEPVAHGRDMRQEFLAKLYFALKDGSTQAIELVEKQKIACESWLVIAQQACQAVEEDRVYERLVYQFRISQIHSFLEWLAICQAELTK